MECPLCSSEMTGSRCPNCGYTVATKRTADKKGITRKLKALVTTIALVLFLGYLVLNTGLLLLSTDLIYPETLNSGTILFILIPFGLRITELTGYAFAIYYLFLVVSILLSYAMIFYTGWDGLVSYIKSVLDGKFDQLEKNYSETSSPILRLATVFAALIFISYLYVILLEFTGRGIETPGQFLEMPLWRRIFSLTEAAVWEEIIVRVAYIGLPMVIYAAVKGRKKLRKYPLGGFGFEDRFSVILVIISTIIFAMAHLPGWNWDPLKVIQVLPAGIFFGYLFVKDGLHSAILVHFVWDFLSVPDKMMHIPNFNTILSLIILFWMAVGAYYTYAYIKKFNRWITSGQEEEKPEGAHKRESELIGEAEDHTAGVTIGYSCPNCGYTTSEYTDENKLRCKRCGTETDPKSPQAQQQKNLLKRSRWPPS